MKNIICLSIVLLLGLVAPLHSQEVRPVRDDIGFCWDAAQMKKLMEYLSASDSSTPAPTPIVAAISPHDDYLYAGRVYYPLFRSLRTKEAVIFGVTHSTVRKEIGDPKDIILLDDYPLWQAPSGPIAVSPLREFVKARLDTSFYRVSNTAHRLEHSIEALVPFLQYYNPGVKITPIMVTAMSFERMQQVADSLGTIITEYMRMNNLTPGKDIVFLVSSDGNHYGKDFNNLPFGEDDRAHQLATEQDVNIAVSCLGGELSEMHVREFMDKMKDVVWCGRYSIPFGLLAVRDIMTSYGSAHLKGTVVKTSNSYSEGVLPLRKTGMGITAPFSLKHWVAYCSIVYAPE